MTADSTIYAAINAMLSLVPRDKAILASVEISVTLKTDHEKLNNGWVHFLFQRSGASYTRVLFAISTKRVFPESITSWIQSANNDGVQVVGHDGIGSPLHKLSEKLFDELGANPQDCEAEACWLLGEPKVVRIANMKKVGKGQFDRDYKLSIETVELSTAT